MRTPFVPVTSRPSRLLTILFSLLALLAISVASADVNRAAAAPPEGSWVSVNTTAQGQFLTKLQEKLVSDYDQIEGSYDYSVVKKLRISGTLNAVDYTALRNTAYAATSIQKLDLSGVVDTSTQAVSGMTALTDVSLPPVGNYNVANPFAGNTSLKNVVVAAETYQFGSATTFNGITTLERITFLHTTKPAFNASTFNGSNNADPENRTVVASVPDMDRGDYDRATFTGVFSNVVETATPADFAELQVVINEASAITEATAAAPYRWTLLQAALDAAETVHDEADSTSTEIYRARLILQTAINRVGVAEPGVSLKVTKGAEVTLSWKNGTAQHFAEFTPRSVAKVEALSDGDYDVYLPTVTMPYVTQNIASAVIPGETDKVAKIFTMSAALANTQYTLNLTPLEGREDTVSLIPGLGAGDNRNLYTNLNDTGVINLDVGQHFDLDTIRTQQAQLDQINNLFVEPDYTFEVSGESVTTSGIGLDGRRQLRINAEEPGVSVIKITYGPLRYLAANDNGTPGNTNWSFNGIDPQNTGLVVVNVGGSTGSFDTGIEVKNELDTYYFDKTVGERDFTFTPEEGTTVRVHDPLNVTEWGDGWSSYEADSDGSFTVKLKGGRNVIELTNGDDVKHRVVRGKGVDVTVTNTTNPDEPFVAGDNARISINGIEGGIEKLAGIYNPAFAAGTKAKLTYYDGASQLVSNEALQYQTAITTFNLNYTYTGPEDKALNGDMFIGGLGAEWPFHREIPLEGKPANLAAVAIGPYHFGGMPPIYVYGNQVSTSPAAPDVPTDLQVTYGDSSAEVSWTAPAVTGGLPIVGYEVRYSSDGGTTWETETFGTGTSQTLDNLTNGTEYEVQVAAVNRSGTGTFTASQTVTPKTAPGVPGNLAATARYEALDISWSAPNSGGSSITGYRVRYSADGGQNWTVNDHGTETELSLTGLVNNTTYEIQVAAINGEGAGDFTSVVTATPVKTAVTLGTPTVANLTKTGAKVSVDVQPGDLDQSVAVEYSTDSGLNDPTVSATQVVASEAGDTTVDTVLEGLTQGTEYFYRVVAVASDNDRVSSQSASFKTVADDPILPLPAATFEVKAPAGLIHVGRKATVSATGLAASESYRVTIAGNEVASGNATGQGAVSASVVVPKQLGDGTVAVRVEGSLEDRFGSTNLRVVAAKKLKVKVSKVKVRRGKKQRVSVTGLAAGEPVRIIYRGKRIAAPKASKKGTISRTFKVGKSLGKKTIKVVGITNDRQGSKAFRVLR